MPKRICPFNGSFHCSVGVGFFLCESYCLFFSTNNILFSLYILFFPFTFFYSFFFFSNKLRFLPIARFTFFLSLFLIFFLLHSGIPSLSTAKHPRLFPRPPLYGMAAHQAPRGSCALSWPPPLPCAYLRACGETCEKLGKTAIIILILTVAPENGLRGWLVRAF